MGGKTNSGREGGDNPHERDPFQFVDERGFQSVFGQQEHMRRDGGDGSFTGREQNRPLHGGLQQSG